MSHGQKVRLSHKRNFCISQRHLPPKKSRDGSEYKCLKCEDRFGVDKKKLYIKHFYVDHVSHLEEAYQEALSKRPQKDQECSGKSG